MTQINSNWSEDDSRIYVESADTRHSAGTNQPGIDLPTESPASGRHSWTPWEIDTG